jgi:sulfite exporter TauE/SafE
LFQQKSYTGLFLIGLLNGILPCGMVYLGLMGALATQRLVDGALFMFLFGIGTLPMMFTISIAGQFLSQTIRSNINKYVPVFVLLVGCLFILRGLNLGIPYISPKINEIKNQLPVECHTPQP